MKVVTKYDLHLFIPKESSVEKLAESAAKCAILNFEWRFITLVLFNSTILSGVERFLGLYEKGCIVGNCLFYPYFAQTTRQYVIFGTDIENISLMLNWMTYHVFDNTGKFIIVCQSEIPSDCNEVNAVEMFWNHKITNVVFIKIEECNVVFYTSNHPDETCVYGKPVKIICQNTTDKPCFPDFPEKFKNLHNCPLVASTFIQPPYMTIRNGIPAGVDGDLVLLIAEGMNASLEMMTPRHGNGWGRLEEDDQWSGSLRDLVDDVANFSITSAAVTLSRFTHFQMSIGYFSTYVAWVTHIAPMKPSSLKLFHPFQVSSQIVIAASFVFVAFGAWFINSKYFDRKRKSRHRRKLNGPVTPDVIFYSWMICMGLPSTKLPMKQSFLISTLLWIWYCYLLRTLYQVYLISSLQGNFFYDEIDTIEEAFNANYSLGGGGALRDYFIDEPLIYDNWKILNTNEIIPTLIEIGEGKQFVLATNMEYVKTLIKKHDLVAHILSQKVIVCPAVLFYKKFSPLTKAMNMVLWRLVESGLVQKAYNDHATKILSDKDDENEPINLEHYTGCYVILTIGWLTSALLCLGEIFYKKVHKILFNIE